MKNILGVGKGERKSADRDNYLSLNEGVEVVFESKSDLSIRADSLEISEEANSIAIEGKKLMDNRTRDTETIARVTSQQTGSIRAFPSSPRSPGFRSEDIIQDTTLLKHTPRSSLFQSHCRPVEASYSSEGNVAPSSHENIPVRPGLDIQDAGFSTYYSTNRPKATLPIKGSTSNMAHETCSITRTTSPASCPGNSLENIVLVSAIRNFPFLPNLAGRLSDSVHQNSTNVILFFT